MKLTIFTTGGTIDKDYSARAGTYNFEIGEPAIKKILENINPTFQYEIVSLIKKDSLDMTEEDRQHIYDRCRDNLSNKILITHGTDTMIETAKKLSTLEGKIIILVGSSKPAKFSDSDAPFNIGTAIGAIHVLDKGVYIAMNGRIYSWDNVMKVKESGKFKTLK